MTEPISVKAIERKAFLSYHNDGLLEICLGLLLITTFIAYIFVEIFPVFFADVFWIIMIGPISTIWLWPLIYTAAKKSITVPRLGYVEFSPKRTARTKGIIALFFIINIISLFLGSYALISREFSTLLIQNIMIILGVVGLMLFSIVAYLSDIRRFYAYGVITAIALITSHYLLLAFYKPMILLGSLLLIVGCVMLVQFLGRYPTVEIGEPVDVQPEPQ